MGWRVGGVGEDGGQGGEVIWERGKRIEGCSIKGGESSWGLGNEWRVDAWGGTQG